MLYKFHCDIYGFYILSKAVVYQEPLQSNTANLEQIRPNSKPTGILGFCYIDKTVVFLGLETLYMVSGINLMI